MSGPSSAPALASCNLIWAHLMGLSHATDRYATTEQRTQTFQTLVPWKPGSFGQTVPLPCCYITGEVCENLYERKHSGMEVYCRVQSRGQTTTNIPHNCMLRHTRVIANMTSGLGDFQ